MNSQYLELCGEITNRIVNEVLDEQLMTTVNTILKDINGYEVKKYIQTHTDSECVKEFLKLPEVIRTKSLNRIISAYKSKSNNNISTNNDTTTQIVNNVFNEYISYIMKDVVSMAARCLKDKTYDLIEIFFDKLSDDDDIVIKFSEYSEQEQREALGSIAYFLKEKLNVESNLDTPTYKVLECCLKDKDLLLKGSKPHFLDDCLSGTTKWQYTFEPFIAAVNTDNKSYVIIDRNKSIIFASNKYVRPKPTESNAIVSDFFSLQGLKELFEGKVYATDCSIGHIAGIEALKSLSKHYHLHYDINNVSMRLTNNYQK